GGRDGRDEPVFREHRLRARVHEQKAARAVGVLHVPGLKAALAEERAHRVLLVTYEPTGDERRPVQGVYLPDYLRHQARHKLDEVKVYEGVFAPLLHAFHELRNVADVAEKEKYDVAP